MASALAALTALAAFTQEVPERVPLTNLPFPKVSVEVKRDDIMDWSLEACHCTPITFLTMLHVFLSPDTPAERKNFIVKNLDASSVITDNTTQGIII